MDIGVKIYLFIGCVVTTTSIFGYFFITAQEEHGIWWWWSALLAFIMHVAVVTSLAFYF